MALGWVVAGSFLSADGELQAKKSGERQRHEKKKAVSGEYHSVSLRVDTHTQRIEVEAKPGYTLFRLETATTRGIKTADWWW